MIDINLVPVTLRKKSSAGGMLMFLPLDLPPKVLFGAGGALALLVLVHAVLFLLLGVNGMALGVQKAAWHSVQPNKNTLDSLANELKALKEKQKNITDITSAKASGWSRKLNIVSDAVPQSMWLRKLTVDAAGMGIEGSVISQRQNEVAIVSAFANGLKDDEFLMKSFTDVQVDYIQKQRRGQTNTADFKLIAKFPVEAKKPEKK